MEPIFKEPARRRTTVSMKCGSEAKIGHFDGAIVLGYKAENSSIEQYIMGELADTELCKIMDYLESYELHDFILDTMSPTACAIYVSTKIQSAIMEAKNATRKRKKRFGRQE